MTMPIVGAVSFKYDPFGRRIQKVSTAGTSIYAYDGDNLIEETNSAGAVVARYTQTKNVDEPLAEVRSGTTDYYEADGLGSVTSLTSTAGVLAQIYSYDSFGKQTASGSLTNPFQYTAREFDTETGLYYYRARYYDSSIGRFLSEDPLGLDGGINLYAYAEGNPISFEDPSGLSTLVFDRASNTLTVFDRNGNEIATYPAGNSTINPTGDPNTIGSNGPAPTGTFPVRAPIDTANYYPEKFGPYFFPIGKPGSLIRRRGIGIHGGRSGPNSRTEGCIRVGNDTDRKLYNLYRTDPITQITIQ